MTLGPLSHISPVCPALAMGGNQNETFLLLELAKTRTGVVTFLKASVLREFPKLAEEKLVMA